MTTRRSRSRAPARTMAPRTCPLEHTEQTQFVARVKHYYPDVLIAAVPNGGKRNPREAARLKDEGVCRGYPDLLIDEARAGWFGLRIEMKRQRGGSTSADQRAVLAFLDRRGYLAVVCKGAEEAWSLFVHYMEQPKTRQNPVHYTWAAPHQEM